MPRIPSGLDAPCVTRNSKAEEIWTHIFSLIQLRKPWNATHVGSVFHIRELLKGIGWIENISKYVKSKRSYWFNSLLAKTYLGCRWRTKTNRPDQCSNAKNVHKPTWISAVSNLTSKPVAGKLSVDWYGKSHLRLSYTEGTTVNTGRWFIYLLFDTLSGLQHLVHLYHISVFNVITERDNWSSVP